MQAERFRAIRKGLRLTQTELGEYLDLTLGWVSKMELGKAMIDRRTELAMLYLEEHREVVSDRLHVNGSG